jgi:hypothetical protein
MPHPQPAAATATAAVAPAVLSSTLLTLLRPLVGACVRVFAQLYYNPDIVTCVRECQQTRSIALGAGVVWLCGVKSVAEGSSAAAPESKVAEKTA